jgi:small nuclear ribonucleoprotein (snRNP)-like protein
MYFIRRRPLRKRQPPRYVRDQGPPESFPREETGSEATFLKSLVDSHRKVTVVLKNGERFRGHIRYYDQHCFSIGLTARGPRFFIRKDNVCYISED